MSKFNNVCRTEQANNDVSALNANSLCFMQSTESIIGVLQRIGHEHCIETVIVVR